MPLWKCSQCHHEWEGNKFGYQCGWCKSQGSVIENKTHFEKFLDDQVHNKIDFYCKTADVVFVAVIVLALVLIFIVGLLIR
jgi:hypothetical protein